MKLYGSKQVLLSSHMIWASTIKQPCGAIVGVGLQNKLSLEFRYRKRFGFLWVRWIHFWNPHTPKNGLLSVWLWQNRLNYSGSSALVVAIQLIITQRTSNGTTHWSVGSPLDITTVQQDRSRFTSHEGEFTITVQLINFLIYRNVNIITNLFQI
jgi:hypothetical protein